MIQIAVGTNENISRACYMTMFARALKANLIEGAVPCGVANFLALQTLQNSVFLLDLKGLVADSDAISKSLFVGFVIAR